MANLSQSAPPMIIINLRGKKFEVSAPLLVADMLASLGFSPETYLVIRNGVLLSPEDWLVDGDEVSLVSTISGGSW